MFAAKSRVQKKFSERSSVQISDTTKNINQYLINLAQRASHNKKGNGFDLLYLKMSIGFLSRSPKDLTASKNNTLHERSPLMTQRILEHLDGSTSIIEHAHKEIKRSSNPNLLAVYLALELIYLYADLERASEKNSNSYDNKLFHFKGFLTDLLNHDDSKALGRSPAKLEGLYYNHFLQLKESISSVLSSVSEQHRWIITDAALNIFFRLYLNTGFVGTDYYTNASSHFCGRANVRTNASTNRVNLMTDVDAVFQLAYQKHPERFFIYHEENRAFDAPQIPSIIERVFEAPYESPKLAPRKSVDSDTSSVSSKSSSSETVRGGTFAGITRGLSPFRSNATASPAVETRAVMVEAFPVFDEIYNNNSKPRARSAPASLTDSPSQSPERERRVRSSTFGDRLSFVFWGTPLPEENYPGYVYQEPTAPPKHA